MSILFKDGRLTSTRKDVTSFTSSLQSDKRLLKSVIKINEAHIIIMMEQKIIDLSSGIKLLQALDTVKTGVKLNRTAEDIHIIIEEEIIKKTGPEIGGNLHIGKSRNDQVSTAIRMELRENLISIMIVMIKFQETLITLAKKHVRTIIPGYTHLQPAQPVTFAHYLLSHVDMLERDLHRLEEAYKRVNLCPMGAGALATSSFPIDRKRAADLLGFSDVLENSIDAVSSRDFILEIMADLAIAAIGISRLVEDLIIWGSPHYGIIEFPDDFSSTSSIMPQKKNPELLEVVRARVSYVLGNFVTATFIMKALPSAYNLDFQEITPRLWDSLINLIKSLDMLTKFVAHLKVANFTFDGPHNFLTSTELANMLVRKHKVSFRTAHKIVGSLVKTIIANKLTLYDVTPELLNKIASDFSKSLTGISAEEICNSIHPMKFIESHNLVGGPSPMEVERMLKVRKRWTILSRAKISEMKSKLDEAEDKLKSVIKSYTTATANLPKAKS
jgi:argininosuccinate lyase